jgi:hypothetical protein
MWHYVNRARSIPKRSAAMPEEKRPAGQPPPLPPAEHHKIHLKGAVDRMRPDMIIATGFARSVAKDENGLDRVLEIEKMVNLLEGMDDAKIKLLARLADMLNSISERELL